MAHESEKRDRVFCSLIRYQFLGFLLSDFLEERICADNPKTIKELKNTNVRELSHLLSQMFDKASGLSGSGDDPESIRLPEVTRRERVIYSKRR